MKTHLSIVEPKEQIPWQERGQNLQICSIIALFVAHPN